MNQDYIKIKTTIEELAKFSYELNLKVQELETSIMIYKVTDEQFIKQYKKVEKIFNKIEKILLSSKLEIIKLQTKECFEISIIKKEN